MYFARLFPFFLLWAIMALSFPIGKIAVVLADNPFQLIGVRMCLAGVSILSFLFVRNLIYGRIERLNFPSIHQIWLFGVAAVFHVYLAFIPEFWALQFLDSLKVNLLFSLTPFISAFLSFVLLGKTLSRQKWLGLLIGMVGMFAITATQNRSEINFKHLATFSVPELVLMVGIISSCYAWFVIRKLLHLGYSLTFINGVTFFAGGLMSLIHHFVRYSSCGLSPIENRLEFLFWVLLLILISNILGYYLYGKLLHKYSNTFLSFSGFLCPMFGALYSQIFAKLMPTKFAVEPITTLYLIGFALILTGLMIFYHQETFQSSSFF